MSFVVVRNVMCREVNCLHKLCREYTVVVQLCIDASRICNDTSTYGDYGLCHFLESITSWKFFKKYVKFFLINGRISVFSKTVAIVKNGSRPVRNGMEQYYHSNDA